MVARIFPSQFLRYWIIFLCLIHLFHFAVIQPRTTQFQLVSALCQLFWRRFCWPYPHPANTYRTLSVDLPHIRNMTFAVTLSFPVFLWWYNLVGNICWYNSCMAATIWVGAGLQLFIHAKHTPLSRAESPHLFLVSFPCHFSSPSVTQKAFCIIIIIVIIYYYYYYYYYY